MTQVRPQVPLVSFSFDDFPHSAIHVGGAILKDHGLHGTYYVSLGLMNSEIPAGHAFSEEDLLRVKTEGHELGCHTFGHCHAWETRPSVFEESILDNKRMLQQLCPGASFKSFSYPIAAPRPANKRRAAKYYACCRGGGETFNLGATDANNVSASFIEKNRKTPEALRRLIDENARLCGWLVFATHDVTANPSPFGCTPDFFQDLVNHVISSGAKVLPVAEAWETMMQYHNA